MVVVNINSVVLDLVQVGYSTGVCQFRSVIILGNTSCIVIIIMDVSNSRSLNLLYFVNKIVLNTVLNLGSNITFVDCFFDLFIWGFYVSLNQ